MAAGSSIGAASTVTLPRCSGGGGGPPRLRVAIAIRGRAFCRPRLAEREILAIVRLLDEMGIEAVIATMGRRPIRSRESILRADARLEDIAEPDYAGLIIPCAGGGGNGAPAEDSQDFIKLIRSFNVNKKAIAAQNGGVLALARAGILDGRRFAIEDRLAPLAPLGFHRGAGVVRDGNIVTSGRCPLHAGREGGADGTEAMVRRFAACIIKPIRKF